ncbi:MAG: apolipoprotein N-acyltransferase [Deltaproteobacteria bacterium]|nr:apolipoprotein N-acyltransferase [Deltaproteobacteria bacterium]
MLPRVTTRAAIVFALLSAGLYWLAFPPADAGPLAFVALVPLLLAIRGRSVGQAFLLGWLSGSVAIHALVSSSIFAAASRFMPDHRWVPWLLALIIPQIYGALYFGVFAAIATRLASRQLGVRFELLAMAAAWTACEFARSRLGDGCPWVLLAHSQHATLWLIQIADLTGTYGVSFVIVLINAVVASLLPLTARAWRWRLKELVVAGALLLSVWAYGEYQLGRWRSPATAGVRVSLIQGNVPEEWRSSLRRLPDSLRRLGELTTEASRAQPDLVVWPENAVTVSVADNGQLLAGAAAALPPKARLLIGAPRAERRDDGSASLRNSAYLLDESGRVVSVYDKMRLTPYGESLPEIARIFAGRPNAEGEYVAGDRPTQFEVVGRRFATIICYEAIYAELVRDLVLGGAEFVVNISNDGWFGSQPSLEQHFYAALFRAVENRRYLLRATNAGITAVIDPHGTVTMRAPRNQATLLTSEVTPFGALTFYTRYGDVFAWLCVVGVLVALWSPARQRA